MTAVDIVVLAAAVLAVAGLAWFFFAPRRAHAAEMCGGVQRGRVRVAGGYSPDVIRVRQGVPVEITFDRQEAGECTSQVVFPDLRVSAALPAYTQTVVRLRPERAGTFGFACGMNMVHGRLVVDPAPDPAPPDSVSAGPAVEPAVAPDALPAPDPVESPDLVESPDPVEVEAAQAAERRGEIRDLARRVLVGAVLTAPVLLAVLAGPLRNHWLQLALITPVMLYAGWPIHRTGWLA